MRFCSVVLALVVALPAVASDPIRAQISARQRRVENPQFLPAVVPWQPQPRGPLLDSRLMKMVLLPDQALTGLVLDAIRPKFNFVLAPKGPFPIGLVQEIPPGAKIAPWWQQWR